MAPGCMTDSGRSSDLGTHQAQRLAKFAGKAKKNLKWLTDDIISNRLKSVFPAYEIFRAVCTAGFGVGGGGDGFGADGDAICHSRPGSGGAKIGRLDAGGCGAGGGWAGSADGDRAEVLQRAGPGGENHVATASARDQGEAGLAVARGSESGTDAHRDTRRGGAERAGGGVKYPAAGAGSGIDRRNADAGTSGRPGVGTKSAGEREPGGGAENQLAGGRRGGFSGVRDAEFRGPAFRQCEPSPAGLGIQAGERERGGCAGPKFADAG